MPLPLIHYLYPSGLSKYLSQSSSGESSWALVTGASDGIGRALCSELSARGFNVILHGRNASKLEKVRDELQAEHPQRGYRTVVIDASSFSITDIQSVAEEVKDLNLTVLINNAGGTGPLSSNFKCFEDTTPAEIQALYSLNILFPLQLTRALLPQLQSRKSPVLIMTCGSQSFVGQAYISTYSSTKGALHAWNRALTAEMISEKQSNVEVLEVVVGATYTQQFYEDKNFAPGLFMPTADVMARSILDRVGYGSRSVTAYFWHGVQSFALFNVLPASVADALVANVLKPSVERIKRD